MEDIAADLNHSEEAPLPDKPISDDLADVIRRIEAAAYDRGWIDALKHVVSAAQSAHAPPVDTKDVTPQQRQRKAEYGAIGEVLESALDAFADRGVSPIDVVEHGREVFGRDLMEPSVRGRLNRMTKNRELTKDRKMGRWFRAREQEHAAERETGDGDASPADDLDLYRRQHAAA